MGILIDLLARVASGPSPLNGAEDWHLNQRRALTRTFRRSAEPRPKRAGHILQEFLVSRDANAVRSHWGTRMSGARSIRDSDICKCVEPPSSVWHSWWNSPRRAGCRWPAGTIGGRSSSGGRIGRSEADSGELASPPRSHQVFLRGLETGAE